MSLAIYQKLLPLTDFTKITGRDGFVNVPSDWYVVLSDLRGSTKAIEEGRYKEVNLLGASGIAVIQNVIGTRDFPFTFGGDGATCLLPPEETSLVKHALQLLQNHAQKQYQMTLRVGIVPVADVLASGGKIEFAKYQMSPGANIGLFRGGGLQIAEALIKNDPRGKYALPLIEDNTPPPLENLSCRWAPIANRNGTIVSVMIQAKSSASASSVLQIILAEIHPIFEAEAYRPISIEGMHLDSLWTLLRRELGFRQDLNISGKLRKVIIPVLWLRLIKFFPSSNGKKDLQSYVEQNLSSSDYKKLDDTLRMVLDCSIEQSNKLEDLLKKHLAMDEIYYGLQRSDSALMTCIVEGMNQGEHIHFIDGTDGGYALAAKQLKQQIKNPTPR